MNFGLIAMISFLGVVMGVASVLGWVRAGHEGLLWLVIGIAGAIVIARTARGRFFLHGFLAGLFCGMIAPIIQATFFDAYLGHNPSAAESFQQLPEGMSPRVLVLALAPFLGAFSGLILGGLSWLAAKFMRPKAPPVTAT